MSIIKEEEFDYPAYTRTHAPDKTKIQQGTEHRQARFEAAQGRGAIRIERDILEQFKQIAPDASDYESAINAALREWLAAKTLKALLHDEFQHIEQTILSTIQVSHTRSSSKNAKRLQRSNA